MKTQNFGRSDGHAAFHDEVLQTIVAPIVVRALYFCPALKNYRKNRENGESIDNPKLPFPNAGFDELDIKDSTSLNKWPDPQGRYWWRIMLNNGQVVNDFYWMKDEQRGWPDKSDSHRYWFIVHHAPTGTKIEGFSHEADYERGFPENGRYWYYIRFTDTESPTIAQWMKEKDENYLTRLKLEEEGNCVIAQQISVSDSNELFMQNTLISEDNEDEAVVIPSLNMPNLDNSRDEFDNFINACSEGDLSEVARLLTKNPSYLEQEKYSDHGKALHIAALEGKFKVVHYLLDQGARVNEIEELKSTPLHSLISGFLDENLTTDTHEFKEKLKTYSTLISKLIDLGANINAQSCNGTILHTLYSSYQQHDTDDHEITQSLERQIILMFNKLFEISDKKDAVININAQNLDGQTVLHLAVAAGHYNTVEFLLEKKASIHIPDYTRESETSLMLSKLLFEEQSDTEESEEDMNSYHAIYQLLTFAHQELELWDTWTLPGSNPEYNSLIQWLPKKVLEDALSLQRLSLFFKPSTSVSMAPEESSPSLKRKRSESEWELEEQPPFKK
jgi:ankyrin repeat protein